MKTYRQACGIRRFYDPSADNRLINTGAQPDGGRGGATVVLVRPDGHVDLRVAARDADRVRARLDELLLPRQAHMANPQPTGE